MTGQAQLKPPTTFEQQLEIFKIRGLIIENEDKALEILKRINYYRLSAYTLTFKTDDRFHEGTSFATIYDHYEFDVKLRQLLMKMIEYIEINFRTSIAYLIAHKYGSDGHNQPGTFRNDEWAVTFNEELNKNLGKSKDLFIMHHYNRYEGRFPIWVSIEVLQFSWLSKLFQNLKISDQRKISKKYNAHYSEVSNWLHFLSITRNRCAHYSRLFNYNYPVHIKFRRQDKSYNIETNKVFSAIFNMKYLITDRSVWRSYILELEALIEQYNCIDIQKLGFQEKWKKMLES